MIKYKRKIIAIGGDSDNITATDTVEEYDPQYDKWSPMPSLIVGRFGHAVTIVYGHYLYAIGGSDSNGLIAGIEVLDLERGEQWMEVKV